ncbi:5451_t:CDS:2, partial [Acaulospora morrowiae]
GDVASTAVAAGVASYSGASSVVLGNFYIPVASSVLRFAAFRFAFREISGGGNCCGALWLMAAAITAAFHALHGVVSYCGVVCSGILCCSVLSCLAARYTVVYHVMAFHLACCTVASRHSCGVSCTLVLCGGILSVSEAWFYAAVFKSSGVLVAISHCGVVSSMLRHYIAAASGTYNGIPSRQLHAMATSRRCGGDPITWRHPALQVVTSFCSGVPSILWQSHIAAASGAYSGNFVLRRRPGSAAAILYCGSVPALVFRFHGAAATSCPGSIRSFLRHLHGVVASLCYGVPAVQWCPCATLVSLRYVGILASYYVSLSYDAMSHLSSFWCVGSSCHVIRSLFRPKSVGQIIDSVPVNGTFGVGANIDVCPGHLCDVKVAFLVEKYEWKIKGLLKNSRLTVEYVHDIEPLECQLSVPFPPSDTFNDLHKFNLEARWFIYFQS